MDAISLCHVKVGAGEHNHVVRNILPEIPATRYITRLRQIKG